jgi:tellurite resistance protein TehA-like permease
VCIAFIAALTVVATQLLAHWVTGGVSMQSIHPGYFLPVVAGSFVASIGFSSVHVHDAALAAFGIGAFFWLVVGTVVTVRLMTAGPLPPSAKTGLSAYLAAPATASPALPGWFHTRDLWEPCSWASQECSSSCCSCRYCS